ncbi:MAG: PKD domain-containing protein [Candidatus Aminicenantes bacterium]|nr:PKD domain-containing protein [Candidatus Aminicenantes bacterium]
MNKTLFYLTLILLLCMPYLSGENIHFGHGQIFPGTQVEFDIQGGGPPHVQHTYKWNFGDGTPPVSGTQSSVTHSYKEPGNYHVTCEKKPPGGDPTLLSTQVTVTERRTVEPKGHNFMAGNPVLFESKYFVNNTLNWDFGDGTISNGQKNREHTYQNAGNFTVKVKDYGGNSSSVITCTVNIVPDNRSVEFQPPSPRAGQIITFQARNFSTGNLKWEFKDGTTTNGGPSIEHTYTAQGNYNIKVTDLGVGPGSFIEQRINIAPDNRSINMNPPNPSLYSEVTFNLVNFTSGSIEWDFDRGDRRNGGIMEKHTFSNMGSFNIKAREAGSQGPYVTLNISINQDMRRIQVQPQSAMIGQQVMIKLQNSSANTIRWKIGNDNPINNSPKEIQYKFKDPGRIDIIAEIQGQSPVRQTITVNDNRTIEAGSKYIYERGETKYVTKRFNSPTLKWDFGDGTIRNGGHHMIYKYVRPGNFTIKVYDFDGTSKVPVRLRVNVLRDNREIVTTQKILFENSEIEFEAKNFIDNRVKWNFNNRIEKRGGRRIKHKFTRAGMYKVYAIDFDGKGDKKIELNFNVVKDNRNFQLGNNIIAGVPVSMKMTNSQGGNFEWKFMGGKTASGQNPGAIIFNTPGMKTITIIDRSGLYPPVTKTINVQPDNRSLVLGSKAILKGEALQLSAKNFKGSVKWDFGDGTPPKILSKVITHKYKTTGSFTITALDHEGTGKKLFKKTITVKEQMDDFNISALELTFSNSKYYRVIPMKSLSPGYILKLKLKGKGIITGNWLFDGKVLGIFTKLLSGRNLIILKGNDLPKLPILEPGVHSLSFEFTNFKFDGRIPVLRYFVTNSGAIRTISPLTGSKLKPGKLLRLKWRKKKKGDRFEIAVSEVPFQFMSEKRIKWEKTEENNYFDLDTSSYTYGKWIYWQVRIVDATGTISTASEISYFKFL